MSNEVTNYDEELAKLAKRAVATEKPTTSTISAKAGVLAYNGTPCPGNKLDCIIIATTHTNLYYDEKWDANNPKNPVCYAYCEDPEAEGAVMVPHPKASKPQSDSCATCWANQWESDPEGGRGKACKNSRKLAIVPAGVTAEDLKTAEVATLTLPVTTVNKMWSPYVHKLAALYNRPPLGMITKLGTMPDIKTQFKITFDEVGPVDISLIGGLIAKADACKSLLEREYDPNPEPTEDDKAKQEAKAKRGKKF